MVHACIGAIIPNRHVLTVRVPKFWDKSHFRRSLWIFFRKVQMRFEQASLATENRNEIDKLHIRSIEMQLLYVAITALISRRKLTRRCPGVPLPLFPICKDYHRLWGRQKTPPCHSWTVLMKQNDAIELAFASKLIAQTLDRKRSNFGPETRGNHIPASCFLSRRAPCVSSLI